jgi:hypothetical protein
VFGDWAELGTLFRRGFFGLQFLSEEYLDCVIAFNPVLLAKEQGGFQRQLAQPFPDTPQMGVFVMKGFGKPYDFLCLNRFGDQIQNGGKLGFHGLFGFVTYGGHFIFQLGIFTRVLTGWATRCYKAGRVDCLNSRRVTNTISVNKLIIAKASQT